MGLIAGTEPICCAAPSDGNGAAYEWFLQVAMRACSEEPLTGVTDLAGTLSAALNPMPIFSHRVLVLEGVPEAEELARRADAHRADGISGAVRDFARLYPGVIVVSSEVDWHLAFVSGIGPEHRPAVIGIADGPPPDEASVDEWISS